MNPKLQHCLQEYKFAIYNNEEQKIRSAITGFQQLVPSDLPNDKLDIFEEHFENALGTFALVKNCLLYTSPSPRDRQKSRMPSSA